MKPNRQPLLLATVMTVALVLAGCGKSQDDTTSAVPAGPPPTATTTMPPAAASTAMTGNMPAATTPSTVMVGAVELGTGVDAASGKVTTRGDSFAPKDAIYAAVDTSGSGNATLSARWSYQNGQVVHEDSKSITSNAPQTTTFMISKPSGFPAGNYKVDISLDGKQVASRDFSVK